MEKNKYYDYKMKRYLSEGEDMIIWSVYNGRNLDGTVNRTQIKIKDLNDIKIKESIKKFKNQNLTAIGMTKTEILNDVVLKRRTKKIQRICSRMVTR
jgi:hypothetical protein